MTPTILPHAQVRWKPWERRQGTNNGTQTETGSGPVSEVLIGLSPWN